jgi:hypothetical protein
MKEQCLKMEARTPKMENPKKILRRGIAVERETKNSESGERAAETRMSGSVSDVSGHAMCSPSNCKKKKRFFFNTKKYNI